MTGSIRRVLLALVLSAMLVGSAVTGSVAATDHGPDAESPDDAYVTEDGDVVLVYEDDDMDSESGEGQLGMDVEENLVYGLMTDSVEEPPDVTWDVSAVAQPTSLTANGTLAFPQPDFIDSFDMTITGEATPEDARSDLQISARTSGESGYGGLIQSVTTTGDVEMGPDRFFATGDFEARTPMPMGPASSSSLHLEQIDDGYELTVAEDRPLSAMEVEDWQNRSAATETIREQYVSTETGDLNGTASVSLDSYSLTESDAGQQRLDVEYTVTYSGVSEALEDEIATQLAMEEGTSEEAAQQLASELFAANLEEISYNVVNEGGTINGNATVDVRDYKGLVQAYFEYVGSLQSEEGTAAANVEQMQAQFEAQQAAELEQRYTWSGELTGDDGALALDVSLDYRTTNWSAYVDELRNRDVPWYESRYSLNGSSDGEEIALVGSMALEGEELYDSTLDQLGGMSTGGAVTPDWSDALVRSGPQTARVEGSYDEDGLRVEAGASFSNLSALRDAIAEEQDLPPADEVVGRYDADNGTTHVRVNGAVTADAAESDVRTLAYVGEETTVHLPGSWDREFPSMDVEQAESFVDEAGAAGGVGPGFGVAIALVALLAVALIAARRR